MKTFAKIALVVELLGGLLGTMSGGLSVVVGIAALKNAWDQRIALALTSFAALWVMVIQVARKNAQLRTAMVPRISVACARTVDGCVTALTRTILVIHGNAVEGIRRFYRIEVRSAFRGAVTNCRGQLLRIETAGGMPLWGTDEALLTFAPGETPDALAKSIPHNGVAFLDVLLITREGEIKIATPGRTWRYLPLAQIFSAPGRYFLSILISADEMESITLRLDFVWAGDFNNSELTLIG